jgi:alpha-D-ribose 1-methylphosphonate 5-phosphate C-P lyase
MAQFYASIQGNHGPATRVGTKESGILAQVTGWDVGISIEAHHKNNEDIIEVIPNGGDNGSTAVPVLIKFYDNTTIVHTKTHRIIVRKNGDTIVQEL